MTSKYFICIAILALTWAFSHEKAYGTEIKFPVRVGSTAEQAASQVYDLVVGNIPEYAKVDREWFVRETCKQVTDCTVEAEVEYKLRAPSLPDSLIGLATQNERLTGVTSMLNDSLIEERRSKSALQEENSVLNQQLSEKDQMLAMQSTDLDQKELAILSLNEQIEKDKELAFIEQEGLKGERDIAESDLVVAESNLLATYQYGGTALFGLALLALRFLRSSNRNNRAAKAAVQAQLEVIEVAEATQQELLTSNEELNKFKQEKEKQENHIRANSAIGDKLTKPEYLGDTVVIRNGSRKQYGSFKLPKNVHKLTKQLNHTESSLFSKLMVDVIHLERSPSRPGREGRYYKVPGRQGDYLLKDNDIPSSKMVKAIGSQECADAYDPSIEEIVHKAKAEELTRNKRVA